MYLANVKQTVITAKLRNYKSSLEKATVNDDATIKVYEALMKGVEEGLDTNHQFISSKRKLLNMDKIHMYDLYVNPFEQKEDKISFEEAKKRSERCISYIRKRIW